MTGVRGRFVFKRPDQNDVVLSAEDLAVVIIGQRTNITTSALHYAAKHDVTLLAVDWKGVPFAGMYRWGEHTRVGARHRAQATLSVPRQKNAWMQIIRSKIRGQAINLQSRAPEGMRRLMDIAAKVRSGDPDNSEGHAARVYWARLFDPDIGFMRETDGADNLNAMLNYGYTVLRGFGIRAVLGAGLSPTLGLFHRGRSNYFNLVDDLIEPFRPAVDAVVVSLGADAMIDDAEAKRSVVASACQPFSDTGLRIPAVLDDLAQQFGQYVEGDVARLDVPTWDGVVNLDADIGADDDQK